MNFLFYALFVFTITIQATTQKGSSKKAAVRAAIAELWMKQSENQSAYYGDREEWEVPYVSPGEFSFYSLFPETHFQKMYHCVRFRPEDFRFSGLREHLLQQASLSTTAYCHLRLCLKTFKGISTLIPKETRSLSLTGNFVNTISANDFQGLSSIEKLYLGECDIKKIDADAFKNLKDLRLLVLENNPISKDPESRKNLEQALSKTNPECEIVWGPISR